MNNALAVLEHLNGSFDPDDWCGDVSMLDKSQEGIDALRKALKEDNEVSFDKVEPAPEPLLTDDEIETAMHTALPSMSYASEAAFMDGVKVGAALVRQKAGLK